MLTALLVTRLKSVERLCDINGALTGGAIGLVHIILLPAAGRHTNINKIVSRAISTT